jgi:hypothetical protein
LLRTAYVEALYRAPDFEFHRLSMSFWLAFIRNVSESMTSQTLWDKFPPVITHSYSKFTLLPGFYPLFTWRMIEKYSFLLLILFFERKFHILGYYVLRNALYNLFDNRTQIALILYVFF